MKSLANRLCMQLEETHMTKLKQNNYKMIEPTALECKTPIIYRGVIISENVLTFESTPVGYLQVFEV